MHAAISEEAIKRIVDTQLNLPEGFTPHPRLQPLLARRATMVEQNAIDWATGELLPGERRRLRRHRHRLPPPDISGHPRRIHTGFIL